MYFSFI